jgi:NAD-dependent SIR2 family protein deacetylase
VADRLETYECHKCKAQWKAKAGPQTHFKGYKKDGEPLVHACPKCDSMYCTWVTYEEFKKIREAANGDRSS